MALELNQTCYKNAGVCQTLHKITQPKLDSGVVSSKKIFRSVHPALVLFNKGLWNKNKRKQKQQRTDSPFSIKGATHLMILMHINNHAKHIGTRQTNLPTSSRFPFVSFRFLTLWSMVLHQLGSACNFSRSCHVVSAKSYQVHCIMIFGKCAMPVCSRGALQQLTVLAQNRKSWEHVFQFFPDV